MRHDIVKTIVLAAVAALTGGLAGSIFTAVVTHQHPTVVTYKAVLPNVVDSRTTALVHDLKIGNDNVKSIYTRVFDFAVQSGPTVASASLVIYFQPDLKIFGMEAIPPSKVRPDWMKCQQSPSDASAVVCDLQNLSPGNLSHYQLSIATNLQHGAKVQSLTASVETLPYDKYLDRKILIFCVVSLGIFFGSFPLVGRLRSWLEMR